jgi:hypothetical protein
MNLKPSPRKVNDRILSPELRAKIDGKLDKISAEAIYRKKPIPTDPETLIKMDELSAAVRSAIQSGGGGEPGSGGGSYDDTELRTRISNVETEIAAHKVDEVKHITSAERASWNNKAEVNQIPTKVSQLENDREYVTQEELGNTGYGDMVKAVYDTNDDGIVDVAETVIGNEIQLGSYKLVYNSTINSLDIEVIA